MTLTERETRIVELTKRLVMLKVAALPGHTFGHGFLWGHITIRRAQKNGKVREFAVKKCFGSICVNDFAEAERLARTVADVKHTFVNID